MVIYDPIAMDFGAGAEGKNRLAMGKIGGLISSLVLTLVNGPGRYQVFDRLIEKFCGKTKEKTIGELLTAPYHYHEVKEYYYKPELA